MKKDDTKLGFYIVLGAAALAASFSAGKKSQQAAQEVVEPSRPALSRQAPAAASDPVRRPSAAAGYRDRPEERERPQNRDSRL